MGMEMAEEFSTFKKNIEINYTAQMGCQEFCLQSNRLIMTEKASPLKSDATEKGASQLLFRSHLQLQRGDCCC